MEVQFHAFLTSALATHNGHHRRPISTVPYTYGITSWVSRRASVDASENKKSPASIENRTTIHVPSFPQNGQSNKYDLHS